MVSCVIWSFRKGQTAFPETISTPIRFSYSQQEQHAIEWFQPWPFPVYREGVYLQYLAAVLDIYSRKVVGWAMDKQMEQELVATALQMATRQRRPGEGVLHHSDRGSQYAAHDYQQLLGAHKMAVSMSRKGDCYDNAVMESFWATLKAECATEIYNSRSEARQSIFEYMEVWYLRHEVAFNECLCLKP